MNTIRTRSLVVVVLWWMTRMIGPPLYGQDETRTPAAADLPRLMEALNDAKASVREHAAMRIGTMGPGASAAVPALIRRLADTDPYVAGKASIALATIGRASITPLTRALADTDPSVRFSAAVALAKMHAPESLPSLREALDDADPRVRWTAVIGIGDMGRSAAAAVAPLTRLLADRDEDVRIEAGRALEMVSPGFVASDGCVAVIDSLVPRLMEELHVPGVSVALIRDRTLAWSGSYGYADDAKRVAVNPRTLFEACSMSKPVFACIVLKLVEEGRIALDRPLSDYLNEPTGDLRPITARMALSHTSGLPNWRKGDEEREGPLRLGFAPGARFSYSGEGIYYLQRVVERILGEPLDVFAARRLFRPLGLSSCSYVWNDSLDARIASGHDEHGKFLQKTAYVHPNAAYTLYVSAEDYARLVVEVMKSDRSASYSLSLRSVDTMFTPQVGVGSRDPIVRPGRGRGLSVSWGLGWCINSTVGGDIVHHSGSNRSGFRCYCQFSRSRGTGIVIMTNGANGGELWTRVVSRIGDL